jgi:hypothetical protein
VLLDIPDRLAHRPHLLRLLVRNIEAELLLEGHHEFHGVEGVRPEILDERGLQRNLLCLDARLIPLKCMRLKQLQITIPPSTVITCPVM